MWAFSFFVSWVGFGLVLFSVFKMIHSVLLLCGIFLDSAIGGKLSQVLQVVS